MSHNLKNDVIIVGAGYMAIEYAKVLKDLNKNFIVVGRGEESAKKFEDEIGIKVIRGGLEKFLSMSDSLPNYAIIAVGVNELAQNCISLIKSGIKNILLEKPGAIFLKDFETINELIKKYNSQVSIAYNRRFYSSTRAAKKFIAEDGGVISFQFEFTEWLHVFEKIGKVVDLSKLFLSNSTHVVDLAFYLGGVPEKISCFGNGENQNYNSIFSGAGITKNGAFFNYGANWNSAGRWSAEFMTKKRRFIFRPLEKLQVWQMKTVKIDFVDIDDSLDINYKPGLYLETKAFLEHNEDFADLCSFEKHYSMLPIYRKIAGAL